MIKSKLIAMCVCPALLAPPVVLAVNKPARHAVAHLLHRTADKLDHGTPAPAPQTAFADLPCTPTFAGTGNGLQFGSAEPLTGGTLLASAAGSPGGTAAPVYDPVSRGFPSGGGSGGTRSSAGGTGGGGSTGGGSGPGSGTGLGGAGDTGSGGDGSGSIVLNPTPPTSPTSPASPAMPITPVSGVPEPHSWVQMITGLGMVGSTLRFRRPVAA